MDAEAHPRSVSGHEPPRAGLTRRLQALVASAEPEPEPTPPTTAGVMGSHDLDAVDARLAAIEDSLDGLAERLEALTRDNAVKTAERLTIIDERVTAVAAAIERSWATPVVTQTSAPDPLPAIEESLEAVAARLETLTRDRSGETVERLEILDDRVAAVAAALERSVAAAAQNAAPVIDPADRFEDLTETVRSALDELGATVDGSLGSLGAAVTSQADQRIDERVHLDGILGGLRQTIITGFAAISERAEALQAATPEIDPHEVEAERRRTETVLIGLRQSIADGFTALGSQIATYQISTVLDPAAERARLEGLLADLQLTVEGGFSGLGQQVASQQRPVDSQLEELHGAVLDGFGGARERMIAALEGSIGRLELTNAEVRATLDSEVAALRGDMADALDEVCERVEGLVSAASESIAVTLGEHRATSTQLGAGLLNATGELRDSVVAATNQLRDRVESSAGELQPVIVAAAGHAEAGHQGVADLIDVVGRLDAAVGVLSNDWEPKVEAVVAQGHAAAHSVLEEVQDEVDTALTEVTTALTEQLQVIRTVEGSLDGNAERLVAAGQALIDYLAERDRLLERERDQVLHEVLADFADGLSARQRRALTSRMGDALDRHRDARDAERFRRGESARPDLDLAGVPTTLDELAAESALEVDSPSTPTSEEIDPPWVGVPMPAPVEVPAAPPPAAPVVAPVVSEPVVPVPVVMPTPVVEAPPTAPVAPTTNSRPAAKKSVAATKKVAKSTPARSSSKAAQAAARTGATAAKTAPKPAADRTATPRKTAASTRSATAKKAGSRTPPK